MRRFIQFVVVFLALCPAVWTDSANKRLDIYWCDVEGGAATLIVTPAGEAVLVDSGWPGERDPARIVKIAKEVAGLNQIDHYVTTHWHTDHFGGIGKLAELIPVKNFYDHGFPELPKPDIPPALVDAYKRASGDKSRVLRPGDEIQLKQMQGSPQLTLRVLAGHGIVAGESSDAPQIRACAANPKHEPKPEDTSDNARSVTFVLSFGNWEFFDAGDLTWNVEHRLACPKNLAGKVDVYQVTHHGLDTSNNPAILQALEPRVAVMNNGPRKGGTVAAVRALKAQPGVEAVFAVHRNVQTGPDDNALPELTANDDEQCKAEFLSLSVAPDGRSYTMKVPSKNTTKTFRTK